MQDGSTRALTSSDKTEIMGMCVYVCMFISNKFPTGMSRQLSLQGQRILGFAHGPVGIQYNTMQYNTIPTGNQRFNIHWYGCHR